MGLTNGVREDVNAQKEGGIGLCLRVWIKCEADANARQHKTKQEKERDKRQGLVLRISLGKRTLLIIL
jgi:hypothetical protein